MITLVSLFLSSAKNLSFFTSRLETEREREREESVSHGNLLGGSRAWLSTVKCLQQSKKASRFSYAAKIDTESLNLTRCDTHGVSSFETSHVQAHYFQQKDLHLATGMHKDKKTNHVMVSSYRSNSIRQQS